MITQRDLTADVVLIEVGPHLDTLNLARFEPRAQPRAVVICDLRTTRSMDPEGFAWLVDLHLRQRRHDGQLHLVGPSPALAEALRRDGLLSLFRWHADLGEIAANLPAFRQQHLHFAR